jgi:hypothetical protein
MHNRFDSLLVFGVPVQQVTVRLTGGGAGGNRG